jgi:hypothetical protein
MHLIQILLPITDNQGRAFSQEALRSIQSELTEQFGGLTAYSRAPAKGLWAKDSAHHQDDIVILEVMTDSIDAPWWQALRRRLEEELRQEKIIIRAQTMQTL